MTDTFMAAPMSATTSFSNVVSLFDGDRSWSVDRAAVLVSAETVRRAQEDAAYQERAERAQYRLDVVTRYTQAAGWDAEMAVLAEAVRYDKAHPSESPLFDELHGMTLGLAA